MEIHRQHERRSSLTIRRNSKTINAINAINANHHSHIGASASISIVAESADEAPAQSASLSVSRSPARVMQQQAPTAAERHQPGSKKLLSMLTAIANWGRHRSSTPVLWTILLTLCVALAGSLRARPPITEVPQIAGIGIHRQQHEHVNLRRHLNIFGDDDRHPVGDPSAYPYSAVGLLRWSDTSSCTASLIASKFIVTAAECVLDAAGNVRASTFDKPKFLPGYVSGETAAQAEEALVIKVHKQSDFWKRWTQNTYVILELDSAIGLRYGVLQLPTLSDLDQSVGKTDVQIAGYDDKALDLSKAAMQYAKCTCYFPTSFNGPQYLLLHDCDTSGVGSPGSPLLVRYASLKTYIIGIHSNAIASPVIPAEAVDKFRDSNLEKANRGVLGPFIQLHLETLVGALSSDGGTSITATTTAPTTKPETTATPTSSAPDSASSRAHVDDGDLQKGPAATTSSGNSASERITPAAAYICIVVVCLAWACILFIAVRHVRRGGMQQQQQEDAIE